MTFSSRATCTSCTWSDLFARELFSFVGWKPRSSIASTKGVYIENHRKQLTKWTWDAMAMIHGVIGGQRQKPARWGDCCRLMWQNISNWQAPEPQKWRPPQNCRLDRDLGDLGCPDSKTCWPRIAGEAHQAAEVLWKTAGWASHWNEVGN